MCFRSCKNYFPGAPVWKSWCEWGIWLWLVAATRVCCKAYAASIIEHTGKWNKNKYKKRLTSARPESSRERGIRSCSFGWNQKNSMFRATSYFLLMLILKTFLIKFVIGINTEFFRRPNTLCGISSVPLFTRSPFERALSNLLILWAALKKLGADRKVQLQLMYV